MTFLQQLVDRRRTPGIQYARLGADGNIRSFAAGFADLRTQRPMTNDTYLMAYSVSKVLTAEVVVQLCKQGLLNLDDPIAKFLSWQPYGEAVTVRHLLTHRSGIPNPIPLRWVHLAENHAGFDEMNALQSVLRKHNRLKFAPGSAELYSNLGYWLLGMIIENLTGEAFSEVVPRQLGVEIAYEFPAHASHASGYLKKYSLLNLVRPFLTAPEIAAGYERGWLRIRDHYVNGPAFGGAVGSATSFCRIARRLLERADSWGIIGKGIIGKGIIEKEGGGAGFSALLRLDRTRNVAQVLMANTTGVNLSAILDQLTGWRSGN